ncbi:MAG TPA: CheR family methyltransferase, partial [Rariglobus sp.]
RFDAIEQATRGVFSEIEMAAVSPERRARFFRSHEAGWEVVPVVKRRMRWHTADVMGLEMETGQDLILFRNVAIYFTERQATAAWARLCDCLAPGGFLVTGKAERPSPELPLKRIATSIYRRTAA